ncbi:hypothetical protein NDU88_000226 [Pleurodeles waltl]|uniref:Uncharacterized protein n=1 Tax=Pleurodeles waltl TaxID=8319 RepID=A0AAV7P0G0_PLEWA|nr:hypothetical protein NDU88_000226 [Pleurodeles waltl]
MHCSRQVPPFACLPVPPFACLPVPLVNFSLPEDGTGPRRLNKLFNERRPPPPAARREATFRPLLPRCSREGGDLNSYSQHLPTVSL